MKKFAKVIVTTILAVAVVIPFVGTANAAYCRAHVTGLSAESNVDQRVVTATWDYSENVDKYEVQVSRSRSDWSEADLYTTYDNYNSYTIGHRRYNGKGSRYTVDYDVTDTYYVRVRPVIGKKRGMWYRPVKTKIVGNDPVEVEIGEINSQEDLDSLLKAYENLANMYKPTW